MEYQRHIRNAQIERAKNILHHYNVEDVKKGPHDVIKVHQTYIDRKGW